MLLVHPHFVTRIAQRLDALEQRYDEPAPERRWWQRILLSAAGLLLVMAGLIGLCSPLPISFLAVLGWPLLICIHPLVDRVGRRWTAERLHALGRWVRAWRPEPALVLGCLRHQ